MPPLYRQGGDYRKGASLWPPVSGTAASVDKDFVARACVLIGGPCPLDPVPSENSILFYS